MEENPLPIGSTRKLTTTTGDQILANPPSLLHSQIDPVFVLLNIFGSCRACQGDSPEFSLFDDVILEEKNKNKNDEEQNNDNDATATTEGAGAGGDDSDGEGGSTIGGDGDDTTRLRHQLRRALQQDQPNEEDDDDICICESLQEPKKRRGITTYEFEKSFQRALIDVGFIFPNNYNDNDVDFIGDNGGSRINDVPVDEDDIVNVIPVLEQTCDVNEKDFSTVYIYTVPSTSSLIVSEEILSQSLSVVRDIEIAFRRVYNKLQQDQCDIFFRTISNVQFISILENDDTDDSDSDNLENQQQQQRLEFVVEGYCRGKNCKQSQPLFDIRDGVDDDDGGTNNSSNNNRRLEDKSRKERKRKEFRRYRQIPDTEKNQQLSLEHIRADAANLLMRSASTSTSDDAHYDNDEIDDEEEEFYMRRLDQNSMGKPESGDSSSPTVGPTRFPSAKPTPFPTTAEPTFFPTTSQVPTERPSTGRRTRDPTISPSAHPTPFLDDDDEEDASRRTDDEEPICYCPKNNTNTITITIDGDNSDSGSDSGSGNTRRRKLDTNDYNGPPNELEFIVEFTKELRFIMNQYRLPSCHTCIFDDECISGKCLSGRCASGGTVVDAVAANSNNFKLDIGCPCGSNDDCPIDAICAANCDIFDSSSGTTKCFLDSDQDGICDTLDNCPLVFNADQLDQDFDGWGDVCDFCPNDPNNDEDFDNVCGDIDNCPLVSNADQLDSNGDGVGDACETELPTLTSPAPTSIPATSPSSSTHPSVLSDTVCGDGVREGNEVCDGGDGCNDLCSACLENYELLQDDDGEKICDFNECTDDATLCNTNNGGGVCKNTLGSYECLCYNGFIGYNCEETTPCITMNIKDSNDYQELFNYCKSQSVGNECCWDGSSVGLGACGEWTEGNSIEICSGSCRGSRACVAIGFGPGSSIKDKSCVGVDACYRLARASEAKLLIEAASCRGEQSCYGIALDSPNADGITIRAGSCNGRTSACNRIGALAGQTITVEARSCLLTRSCMLVGSQSATDITIASNSCRGGEEACNQVGEGATTVTIGANSCGTEQSCDLCGLLATGDFSIPSNTTACPTL